MIKKININLAINILLSISFLMLIYHIFIILEFIPYEIVWGGRLKTIDEMYRFETVSVLINLAIISIVLVKRNQMKSEFSSKVVTILLWILAGVFILNTVGNLFAKNILEVMIFTPLTLISAVFSFRLAIDK